MKEKCQAVELYYSMISQKKMLTNVHVFVRIYKHKEVKVKGHMRMPTMFINGWLEHIIVIHSHLPFTCRKGYLCLGTDLPGVWGSNIPTDSLQSTIQEQSVIDRQMYLLTD